jgi:hypothetical protein
MIKEGYDFTHVDEIQKRDGQYGMVYGFYSMNRMFNFLVRVPLLVILWLKYKMQVLMEFKMAFVLLLFNPILISPDGFFLIERYGGWTLRRRLNMKKVFDNFLPGGDEKKGMFPDVVASF